MEINKSVSSDLGLEFIKSELSEIKKYTLLGAKSVLTLDEVALLTGLSTSYVYQLTHYKKIPYYKPNGRVLYFDRGEVEKWMKRNRQNSVEEAESAALTYVVDGAVNKGKGKGGVA